MPPLNYTLLDYRSSKEGTTMKTFIQRIIAEVQQIVVALYHTAAPAFVAGVITYLTAHALPVEGNVVSGDLVQLGEEGLAALAAGGAAALAAGKAWIHARTGNMQ